MVIKIYVKFSLFYQHNLLTDVQKVLRNSPILQSVHDSFRDTDAQIPI